MKIDASEDFQVINTRLEGIKMTAALAGDDKCMTDVVAYLAQAIGAVFAFGVRGESEVHKVLMQKAYEDVLAKHGLKRMTEEERKEHEAQAVPKAQSAKAG